LSGGDLNVQPLFGKHQKSKPSARFPLEIRWMRPDAAGASEFMRLAEEACAVESFEVEHRNGPLSRADQADVDRQREQSRAEN